VFERHVKVDTGNGLMNTFIVHPERGGPHPVVLFYMDAPGIREELRDMARRLATVGYYVMLPNLYYRADVEELGSFIGEANLATREKMFKLMATLEIAMVMKDTAALLALAGGDPAASLGAVGTVGYCMSGRYAISAAVSFPERIAAAASIYGTKLFTDQADSPHRTAAGVKAELYVAFAERDHYVPLDEIAPFRDALVAGNVNLEVELYTDVDHGFAFPERPAFNKTAAERHWERLFALYRRRL
jgi:carboxymethylenebutenolidase